MHRLLACTSGTAAACTSPRRWSTACVPPAANTYLYFNEVEGLTGGRKEGTKAPLHVAPGLACVGVCARATTVGASIPVDVPQSWSAATGTPLVPMHACRRGAGARPCADRRRHHFKHRLLLPRRRPGVRGRAAAGGRVIVVHARTVNLAIAFSVLVYSVWAMQERGGGADAELRVTPPLPAHATGSAPHGLCATGPCPPLLRLDHLQVAQRRRQRVGALRHRG